MGPPRAILEEPGAWQMGKSSLLQSRSPGVHLTLGESSNLEWHPTRPGASPGPQSFTNYDISRRIKTNSSRGEEHKDPHIAIDGD